MTTHGTPNPPNPPDPLHDARERALTEFVNPGPLPESARLAEAEAHLLAELERELGVTIEPPTRVPARTVAARPDGGVRGWFARLVAPPLRPALAVAAALVVVTTVWLQVGPARRETAPLMRGPQAPGTPGTPGTIGAWDAQPTVTAMSRNRARLGWAPAPGATHYAVVFLAGDLSEIGRVADLAKNELMLTPGALPTGLPTRGDVLWRVTAYTGPDEIGRSTATPVTLP